MPAQKPVRVQVEVEGLKELIAGLRQSPDRLDKEFRRRFRELAAEVRDQARSNAQGAYPGGKASHRGPQHWKDLINSITSGATAETPTVSIGKAAVPWAMGFEFGSNRYPQFPPPTGGHFFYPAIRSSREDIQDRALKAIDEALNPAFPN